MTMYSGPLFKSNSRPDRLFNDQAFQDLRNFIHDDMTWHCTAPWTCMSLHVKCGRDMPWHNSETNQDWHAMTWLGFSNANGHSSFKLCQRQCWEFLSSHNLYSYYVFNVHCGSRWTWPELDPPEGPAWGRSWPLLEVAGVTVAGAATWVSVSAAWLLSTWCSASWLAELPVATTSPDPDSTTTTDSLAISWPM